MPFPVISHIIKSYKDAVDCRRVKSALLSFGKLHSACVSEYRRLLRASSLDEVFVVVKDNFWWCAQYADFVDLVLRFRSQFAAHQLWVNQNVQLRSGEGFLLVTDGVVEAKSLASSSVLNIKVQGSATVVAEGSVDSTVIVKCYNTSHLQARSYGSSLLHVDGYGSSELHLDSHLGSSLRVKCWDSALVHIDSWDRSTLHMDCYDSSVAKVACHHLTTAYVESFNNSTVQGTSCDSSVFNAGLYHSSTFFVKGCWRSTILLRTSGVGLELAEASVARDLFHHRIFLAEGSPVAVKV